MILENIHTPADVRRLNNSQVEMLCRELRAFLVREISRTGGHLASNLGVVELTVAIHRVFDTSRDRLIFDVGHQCYVHKALTGRQELFHSLRQLGGLSGFPKPYESDHDAFIAGHASNSVSVALGMARARTLQHRGYHVLALIGDGALGGGLSFEGLNNAGSSGEPMIVILNDNGMSIAPNVGAISRYLSDLRTRPFYYALKQKYREALHATDVGRRIYDINHDVKTALKRSIVPSSSLFESMGFTYLGPIDGHDVQQVTEALRWAKQQQGPVLVHVHTVKGNGYRFAEEDPGRFHGIGPFDPATGASCKPAGDTFSAVFGRELTDLAEEDGRICAITAAMLDGTGLTSFAKAFPKRFFDVGIAEGHGTAMAAGMAKQGTIPVFAVYSSFLQRGYDQLIHDIALQQLHVVLAVDRAGLVGADGETHHGIFDVSYLTAIPGMQVYCPASFTELGQMLREAVLETGGPVAVRYPRGGEECYRGDYNGEAVTVLCEGKDAAILTYGILVNNALEAADRLAERNISVQVVKLNRIAPLSTAELCGALGHCGCLLVLEDCLCSGCIGQQVATKLMQNGCAPRKLILQNLGDTIAPQGTVVELYHAFGLDGEGIADTVEVAIHEQ